MGILLSAFRAGPGAAIGTTREVSGAEDAASGGATAATSIDQQPPEFLDQCGIEKNWDSLQPYVAPPRIKECRLTEEERAKFHGHLDLIFEEKTIMGRRIVFDPDDVMQVLIKVKEYLKSEPMLIEDLPFDITVVGDLHGQLYDLERVFRGDEKDGKSGWECMKYLFLGDYVDRGRQSIEIIMALFCLKMLYPDRIFVLRGNHEFVKTNMDYGFIYEFRDRYELETAVMLYAAANEAFCFLSVAAIIGNVYFCAHAGIAPGGFTRTEFRGLVKPFTKSTDDLLVHDVVWSDPAQGLIGHSFNTERGTSQFYGFSALCHALTCMEVAIVIRGHTQLKKGYENVWKCLFSIFTATGVDGINDGSVAVINEKGKISIRVLLVDKERVEWEKMLKGGIADEEDTKTTMDICDGNKTGAITRIRHDL